MKHRVARRRWTDCSARMVLGIAALLCAVPRSGRGDEPRPVSLQGDACGDDSHTGQDPVVTAELPLISGDQLSEEDWTFITRDNNSRLAATWQLQLADGESVLVCRGEPYGYLKTTRTFANFRLRLEWKFPTDENGNSGVLLHTNGQGKDKVWPTAIQVQLHQPVCGSIFPSGEATSDNEIRDVRDVSKAVNQWNSCEITSMAGRISVEMNGKKIGVVTGCQPDRGGIAFQSEGSEVHFRRIHLTLFADGATPLSPVGQLPSFCPGPDGGGRWPVIMPVSLGIEPWGAAALVRSEPLPDAWVTYDVVYRDSVAADNHPLRARHRERLLVGPAETAPVSVGRIGLRGRPPRHVRR